MIEGMRLIKKNDRCGLNGKIIMCPHCEHEITVYHLAWSASTCRGCKVSVDKYDYLTCDESCFGCWLS